jgi:hypothetical protein
MLDRTQVSVICPRNDLESATILDIAQHLGLHCLEVRGSWGLTLADALTQYPDIDALRPEVIVVELPGEAAAELIRSRGKRLHAIDHHGSTPGGKAASLSSLEQFAALVDHALTRKEQEVAIADRDFFPGLSRAGVPWERALELRRGEHAIPNATEALKEARELVCAQAWRQLGRLSLLRAPAHLALMVGFLPKPPNLH